MGHKGTNESGQALVMVLVALLLGTVLVSGVLYYASTSQRAIQAVQMQTTERYAADAGVEHAIWRLTNEAGFTQTVGTNSPYLYTIDVNGQTVAITVSRVLSP